MKHIRGNVDKNSIKMIVLHKKTNVLRSLEQFICVRVCVLLDIEPRASPM